MNPGSESETCERPLEWKHREGDLRIQRVAVRQPRGWDKRAGVNGVFYLSQGR